MRDDPFTTPCNRSADVTGIDLVTSGQDLPCDPMPPGAMQGRHGPANVTAGGGIAENLRGPRRTA